MTENKTTLISAAGKKIVKFHMGMVRGETANIEVSLVFSMFPNDMHEASNYITLMAEYVRGYVHGEFDSWMRSQRYISDGEVADFVNVLGDRIKHTFNLPKGGCWELETMLFNGQVVDGANIRSRLTTNVLLLSA